MITVPCPSPVAFLVLAAGFAAQVSQEKESVAEKAARQLLGDRWIVEPEPAAQRRCLRDRHVFLCRLRARGGFPFLKLVLSGDGKELARSETRELLARAETKRLYVAFRKDGIDVAAEGREPVGLEETLRALRAVLQAEDPGAALSVSLATLSALTVKGEFVSAAVARTKSGLEVTVRWHQGSRFWGFVEAADWTFRFDRAGALLALEKDQRSFERHRRR